MNATASPARQYTERIFANAARIQADADLMVYMALRTMPRDTAHLTLTQPAVAAAVARHTAPTNTAAAVKAAQERIDAETRAAHAADPAGYRIDLTPTVR